MLSNPKVSIVILNWNGEQDTISLLCSLGKLYYSNYQIILIDNGSIEESYIKIINWLLGEKSICFKTCSEILTENLSIIGKGEKIIFYRTLSNLGFAKGANLGIRYALSNEDSFVLLLNNDTEVNPDFLDIMVEKFEENPSLGAVVPQIRYYHNKDLIWNCGGRIFFGFRKYFFSEKSFRDLPLKSDLYITFATGCALLFKPQEVGLLSEKFFFGEEDFEFSYRLKRRRVKMLCAMDAVIYHKVGQSINRKNTKVNKGAIFIYYLNRFVNMKLNFRHKITWKIWRFAYMFYIIYILFSRFSLSQILYFMKTLMTKSSILTEVNKQEFDKALNQFS